MKNETNLETINISETKEKEVSIKPMQININIDKDKCSLMCVNYFLRPNQIVNYFENIPDKTKLGKF